MSKSHNNRLEEVFEQKYKNHPNQDCLIKINKDDSVSKYSYKLVGNLASLLAGYIKKNYLDKKKLKAGSLVVIASNNHPYWLISELALLSLDLVVVPAYATFLAKDFDFLLTDSKAKLVLATDGPHLDQLKKSLKGKSIRSKKIAVIELHKVITAFEKDLLKNPDKEIKYQSGSVKDSKTDALVIYTSGSSGSPKGVRLSHKALLANLSSVKIALFSTIVKTSNTNHRFFSFLPLSHSYEHLAGLWFPLSISASIYYPASREKLIPNILIAKPTIMTAVPRFYEVVRQRILQKINSQSKLVQKIFKKSIQIETKICNNEKLNVFEVVFKNTLAKLLSKKISAIFGPSFLLFVSGGAALNDSVFIFFKSLGLTILQGYGMTECSPVISVNLPRFEKIGSVGKALKGVDVKLSRDNEIMVKGDLLMSGYLNHKEKFLVDGYLKTGDIGEIDRRGYITITDRMRDIIVLATGDTISPQKIESYLNLEEVINQSMVYGNEKPYLTAVIVSSKPSKVAKAVANTNTKLQNYERIRRYIVVKDEFDFENSMLTHSMKVKRTVITKKYQKELEALYKTKQ